MLSVEEIFKKVSVLGSIELNLEKDNKIYSIIVSHPIVKCKNTSTFAYGLGETVEESIRNLWENLKKSDGIHILGTIYTDYYKYNPNTDSIEKINRLKRIL